MKTSGIPMKRVTLGIVLIAVLGTAIPWRLLAGEKPSSSSLSEVTVRSLPSFKADFNREPDAVRILLLLSPT